MKTNDPHAPIWESMMSAEAMCRYFRSRASRAAVAHKVTSIVVALLSSSTVAAVVLPEIAASVPEWARWARVIVSVATVAAVAFQSHFASKEEVTDLAILCSDYGQAFDARKRLWAKYCRDGDIGAAFRATERLDERFSDLRKRSAKYASDRKLIERAQVETKIAHGIPVAG